MLLVLSPDTSEFYDRYLLDIDSAAIDPSAPFLWSDHCSKLAAELQKGRIVVERARAGVTFAGAMIHDWVGAVWVEQATLSRILKLLQDYDNHNVVDHPEVVESKLLSRDRDRFEIYLRLMKKKIMTVVLDTWHSVVYETINDARAYCRSKTSRICEVEHAGGEHETLTLPDTGHGFLGRMYTQLEVRAARLGCCSRVQSGVSDQGYTGQRYLDPHAHPEPTACGIIKSYAGSHTSRAPRTADIYVPKRRLEYLRASWG